ncbi:hypothetical protein quinque_013982 [Culex quinquefasciatus]
MAASNRTLIMVAKCLQNLVEFGGKEPYMEVVNSFIPKNKERMIVFQDQLSSETDPKPPPGCMIEQTNLVLSSSDAGRELATILPICGWPLDQASQMAFLMHHTHEARYGSRSSRSERV